MNCSYTNSTRDAFGNTRARGSAQAVHNYTSLTGRTSLALESVRWCGSVAAVKLRCRCQLLWGCRTAVAAAAYSATAQRTTSCFSCRALSAK
eukprot:UN1344